jgi:hypothetical protein
MKIKFLRTTDSDVYGFPFVEGQVIEVPELSSAMRQWLKEERAELVREEEPELATVGVAERAVVRTKRARKG